MIIYRKALKSTRKKAQKEKKKENDLTKTDLVST